MEKSVILIVISILFVCCKTSEEPIKIEFSTSDEPVTLFYDQESQDVWAISLPFDIKIENSSPTELMFRNYSYFYGSVKANRTISLFLKQDGKLVRQPFSKLKYIDGKKTNLYVVKSKHSIDTTEISRLLFLPYIEKLQNLNQDTLNIGTISEVEARHEGLLESLVQNDSISLLFINEDSNDRYRKETRLVEY